GKSPPGVLRSARRSRGDFRARAISVEAPHRSPYARIMLRFALVLAAGMAFAQTNDIAAAREAVRTAEASHGAQHPATAMMIRNLALAFAEAGYNRQAEYYAQQALEILEARFGAHDVTLVPALNVLTEAY